MDASNNTSSVPGPSRVSVIIRNHNYGRFVAEAVSSLADQTRRPDEVIVVDDGSTDDSEAVIASLVARGLVTTVIRREPPRGPATSFNDGVAASTGDLVLALDADDRLSKHYLQRAESALRDSGADFAYGGEHRFGAQESWSPPREFNADELGVENYVYVSALFRRWLFERTGGFRADLDQLGLEDWAFWIAAVDLGATGIAVDGCWLDYRRHTSGSRNNLRRLAVLRAHLLVHRDHPRVVRLRHLAVWSIRSSRRNVVRLVQAIQR